MPDHIRPPIASPAPTRRRRRPRRLVTTACAVTGVAALVAGSLQPLPTHAAPAAEPVLDAALVRSPELSETTRLADRRFVVTGDRAWELGAADGRYPAAGFHTRGEMGGFWTPSMKMLDGMWFGIDGSWIGDGTRTTSGWGYVRTDLPTTQGVAASRTDFVPDGVGGVVVGLSLRSSTARTVTLKVDAHSELMSAYPWGESTPSQKTENLPDTASSTGRSLLFRDRGTNQAGFHDWAAAVGSSLDPTGASTGTNFRGPQSGDVVCPASDSGASQPTSCDDTAYGRGAGGQLRYRVRLTPGATRTVWFAVGGSQNGPTEARQQLAAALHRPAEALAAKVAARRAVQAASRASLPDAPLLQQSFAWSKQMLAASVQQSEDVRLRVTKAGTAYPKPVATLPEMRWIGAGWPDYTWLFGTDGEYTAFAAVASGQFQAIEDHLRALRDVSDAVNDRSGKIVHEVTPNGAVYFGANADAGNTDETAKFPSTVALVYRWTGDKRFLADMYPASVRAMRYIDTRLDADHDGWPEGLGNVERPGMGPEKLDNAVYTVRGYADLAELARARGDRATARWATGKAQTLIAKFERDWWYGKDGARSYADSLQADNAKTFQRHWIGLTPTDAVLPALPAAAGATARPAGPLASSAHANTTLDQHERSCYTGALGLYHTGTGATTDPAGNPGDTCDSVVSAVPSLTDVFTLNSSIAAVSEGNYGRLGLDQQRRYLTGSARAQLDPSLWEMPGAMPEIVPGGDGDANIDKLFTERSMVMQAWGAYGILWPVVHQWLGVSPDLGHGRVAVVPQLPADQQRAALSDVRLGGSRALDVNARHLGNRWTTTVTRHGRIGLTVGAVLPAGTQVVRATLNGKAVRVQSTRTTRGLEVTHKLPEGRGTTQLVIVTR
ncbi:hypothetical protein FHX74_003350 [Friedmanniella endophytica]|uniref:Glycogen debranching protein n=1 Tax=Microlunatus kandeliicorticis TaxID=1759536 RepID=A0A7W3IV10_9ACTN|nr:glycogen debranching protein [Microlunatus kandeliicorticis]MBA8795714.1 hypothetical protein [Microlunatus kandeliicorticis]